MELKPELTVVEDVIYTHVTQWAKEQVLSDNRDDISKKFTKYEDVVETLDTKVISTFTGELFNPDASIEEGDIKNLTLKRTATHLSQPKEEHHIVADWTANGAALAVTAICPSETDFSTCTDGAGFANPSIVKLLENEMAMETLLKPMFLGEPRG